MLHDILGHDHIQWHTQLIRHYTNLRTYYRTGLYYRFWPYYQNLPSWGFQRILQRVRLANRGRTLLRIPSPVPFGACICSNVETILSCTCHVYGLFEFRTSLGTSILPWYFILHTLSKLYDVPVGFDPPLFWGRILLILRSPKGGCCSISDDLSCICKKCAGMNWNSPVMGFISVQWQSW